MVYDQGRRTKDESYSRWSFVLRLSSNSGRYAMIRAIDHIVILVNDLAAAIADYTALGFTVTPGGEHTGGATHNALVGFDDGVYFELIAFKEPSRQQDHRWR